MRRFLKLLQKDLQATLLPLGFISGISLIIMLFTRIKIATGAWPEETSMIATIIPVVFLPIWVLWQSFQTLRSEWREDTVYTLLILPVPGWQVMLAKLTAILVEYTALLIVIVAGVLACFPMLTHEVLQSIPSVAWLVRNGFLLYLFSLVMLFSMITFVQLAFLVGKMIGKVQGLVALWTLVLGGWLTNKIGALLEPLFRWIPKLPLHKLLRLDEIRQGVVADLDLAPEIGFWLATIAVFILTSYLFEHYVEVNG